MSNTIDHIAAGAVFLRSGNGGVPVGQLLVARRDLLVDAVLRICLSLIGKGNVVMAGSRVFQIIKKTRGALSVNRLPLFRFHPTRLTGWRLDVKRVIDVAGAVTGTIALLPVFLIVAVLTGLISLDPVLFKQTRIGKDGRGFTFYKFRSMVSGDDSRQRQHINAFIRFITRKSVSPVRF